MKLILNRLNSVLTTAKAKATLLDGFCVISNLVYSLCFFSYSVPPWQVLFNHSALAQQ